MEAADVIVVGAGLAGLQCARHLSAAGRDVRLLEASDGVGGRIRTDEVDGYLVDRGFQLLNPAYPAVRRLVDVDALALQSFPAGVTARFEDGRRVLGHPLLAPELVPPTLGVLWSRPGEVAAAARWVAPLLRASAAGDRLAEQLEARVPGTLRESLDRARLRGRLRRVVERFLAGVVLDDDGSTSAAFALLLVRAFLGGAPGLPAAGMQALPRQLAATLGDRVSLGSEVERLHRRSGDVVLTVSGRPVVARHVVVATAGRQAARLTGTDTPETRGVVTQWFATDEPPARTGLLHVDGRVRAGGPVVNTAVVSLAAPSYAPADRHLVQASALLRPGQPAPDGAELARHAADLLGGSAGGWETVARHEVRDALPAQPPPFAERRPVAVDDRVFVCGDHRDTASIQGALVSGERAARAVLGAS